MEVAGGSTHGATRPQPGKVYVMETQEQHSNTETARLVVVGSTTWPLATPEFLLQLVMSWWAAAGSPQVTLVVDGSPVGEALARAWNTDEFPLERHPAPPPQSTRADARRRAQMREHATQLIVYSLGFDPEMDRWLYEAEEQGLPAVTMRLDS